MAANEIDFDELDHAVNNMMDKHRSREGSQKEPAHEEFADKSADEPLYDDYGNDHGDTDHDAHRENDDAIDEERAAEVAEVENQDEPERPEQTEESNENDEHEEPEEPVHDAVVEKAHEGRKPVPAAIRPSSGRFMDVVHPSSNMRGGQHQRRLHARPEPAVHEEPKPQEAEVEPERPNGNVDDRDDASMTPFLPDANEKVEKRPLGSVENQSHDSEEVEEPEHSVLFEGHQDEKGRGEDHSAEIESEVRASSETDEVGTTQQTEDTEAEAPEVDAVESESMGEDTESEPVVTAEAEQKELAKAGETEAASEQAAAELTAAGDIYDVTDYHASVEQPAKRKGALSIVIFVILFIVVFVALGAAAFYIFGVGL
jgi:hypothetical protein